MNTIKPSISAATIVALVGIWSCNMENDNRTGDTLNPSLTESRHDVEDMQAFVEKAASDGMKEIKMAEIAMERATNPKVKELASMIRADHMKASDELKRLAANGRWEIPTQMLPEHKEDLEKLQNLETNEFDEDYVDMMISDHRNAIDMFEDVLETDYRERTAGLDDMDRENSPEMRDNNERYDINDRDRTSEIATNANLDENTDNNRENKANEPAGADMEQLRAWANKTLPVLRKHLEHCQQIDDEI